MPVLVPGCGPGRRRGNRAEEVGAFGEPDGARSCATEPEAARLRPLRAQGNGLNFKR